MRDHDRSDVCMIILTTGVINSFRLHLVLFFVDSAVLFFFSSSRRRHTRLQGDWSSDVCFFSSRRRHTRLQGDWSSDVCSSDLTDSTVPRALGRTPSTRSARRCCDAWTRAAASVTSRLSWSSASRSPAAAPVESARAASASRFWLRQAQIGTRSPKKAEKKSGSLNVPANGGRYP